MAYKNTEDRRRYAREYHARRMQEDPVYAEKYKAREKAKNAAALAKRSTLEGKAAHSAYMVEYTRKRIAEDPAYREKLETYRKTRRNKQWFKDYMAARRADPEFKAQEAEKMRERRAANPEYHRDISRRSKAKAALKDPNFARRHWLKLKYKITLEQYEALLTQQGNVCAICRTAPAYEKPLCVDHNHSKPTGEGNRGLLCDSCNFAIGAMLENPARLRRAAEYLEQWNGST